MQMIDFKEKMIYNF